MGNGHNHPFNCTCRWCLGGNNHGGYVSGRRVTTNGNKGTTSESYINPNAKCPVCGEQVFFYQSPYDGRVFFDELAPLWTKHPCTDNSQVTNKRIVTRQLQVSEVSVAWLDQGWRRFHFDSGETFLDADRILITGYYLNEKARPTIFLRNRLNLSYNNRFYFRLFVEGKNWFFERRWVFSQFPVYLKPNKEEWFFELSTFQVSGETIIRKDGIASIPIADRKTSWDSWLNMSKFQLP